MLYPRVRLKISECEARALNLKFSCVAAFSGVEDIGTKEEPLKDIVKFLFNDLLLLPNLLFSLIIGEETGLRTGLAFVVRKSIVYL